MKGTIKENLINLIFFYEMGKGKILGRIYGWSNEYLIIVIFLAQYGYKFSIPILVTTIIILIVITTIIGREYVKRDWFKIENSIANRENPQLVQIQKELKEIKECLNLKR